MARIIQYDTDEDWSDSDDYTVIDGQAKGTRKLSIGTWIGGALNRVGSVLRTTVFANDDNFVMRTNSANYGNNRVPFKTVADAVVANSMTPITNDEIDAMFTS